MPPELVGQLLHGERPAEPPESMRVRDMASIPALITAARSRPWQAALQPDRIEVAATHRRL
jgi:hypothetical protein